MSDSEVNFANEWPAASITLVIQAEESTLERRGLVNAATPVCYEINENPQSLCKQGIQKKYQSKNIAQ